MIAAERLTPELRDRLARQVARVCPVGMRDQADDLVQMALMKLLRTGQDATLHDTFLRRVAWSVVVDELRRRRRRGEVGMSPSLPDRIANSRQRPPETEVRGQQIGEVLLTCLGGLLPDRRAAVTLYLQDHSVPEVAAVLGWEHKRTANLIYRGMEDLRGALRERGLTP